MAVASLIGTPLHSRTGALNRNQRWREWAGYLAADRYADHHDIEYNAIREAAALIDVSPLYKYLVTGPDAVRLVDRVIVRDATRLQVGQVYYTCWCDEAGKVLDDGTVCRLDETTFRWTAAEPNLRWLELNARRLDVEVEDVSEAVSALAVQGPLAREVLERATGQALGDLRYFRQRAAEISGMAVDVTRTGYTGDLGFEIWMDAGRAPDVWDAVAAAGEGFGARPCGLDAMDVARIEAGLILLDVDYTSARSALIPEQTYSPDELGILGRFVALDKETEFVGRRALERERAAGGPGRRLIGLEVAWEGIESRYEAQGLFPVLEATTSRVAVPVLAGGRQVGKVTSSTWSPVLKRYVALASVDAEHADPATRLEVEWTVEARRGRVGAVVVPLPFFDPPRKRAVVSG